MTASMSPATTARPLRLLGGLLALAAAASEGGGALPPPSFDTCGVTATQDIALVGSGRCVDGSGGGTPWSYTCAEAPCPSMASVDACALVCVADPGCTGFELRNSTFGISSDGGGGGSGGGSAGAPGCFVFVASAPTLQGPGPLPWNWTRVSGVQQAGGRVVVSANSTLDPGACCYKRAYPRPNPRHNPVPAPPFQSAAQQGVYAAKAALARAASAAALPSLTAIIDFCVAHAADNATGEPQDQFGATECPGLADLTGNGSLAPRPNTTQILARFAAELRALELAHGFTEQRNDMDQANLFDPAYPFLLNLFEPCSLGLNLTDDDGHCGLTHVPGGTSMETVMQQIFGVAPPRTGVPPLDFHEAADRIVYSATNYKRSPLGNSLRFGALNAIWRPKYTAPAVLFTPSDSWHYQKVWPHCPHWENCTVGTIDFFNHILLAWMTGGGPTDAGFAPTPTPGSCATQMDFLRSVVCWQPPTRRDHHPKDACPMLSPKELIYWEADLMGSVRYPEGVKFIVAPFRTLFGTALGATVRAWCAHNGWALAWVVEDGARCRDPRRLLDPTVLRSTTVNTTLPPALAPAFEAAWAAANASWPATNFSGYLGAWEGLVNGSSTAGVGAAGVGAALVWSFGVRDCADYDNCIGVVDATGDCACYAA